MENLHIQIVCVTVEVLMLVGMYFIHIAKPSGCPSEPGSFVFCVRYISRDFRFDKRFFFFWHISYLCAVAISVFLVLGFGYLTYLTFANPIA